MIATAVVFIAIATIVVICILKLFWYFRTKKFQHIPAIPGNIPLLGNILSLPKLSIFIREKAKWYEKYGDTICFWVAHEPVICTRNHKVIEHVVSSHKLIDKSSSYWVLKEWLGSGLIGSNGELWRRRRKLLTPSFHFDILKDYVEIIEKHSLHFIECLRKYSATNKSVNAFDVTKMHTLNVICDAAMGVELNAFGCKKHSESYNYIQSIELIDKSVTHRLTAPWQWYSWMFKLFDTGRKYYAALDTAHGFVRKVIEQRIMQRNANNIQKHAKKRNLMDSLLNLYEKDEVDAECILEEINTFMFAGHDTTASALSWCLYTLGRNKTAQENAYNEAKYIKSLGISLENQLVEMKYIDCVIKESLRIYPSVPILSRLIASDLNINGIFIPSGTTLHLDVMQMQRNEKMWSDPMTFMPERFAPHSKTERKNYDFIPFSAGPRNCIGQRFAMMEIKLALYHCLLNFEITSIQDECDIQEYSYIILNSKTGLLLKFAPRLRE